jgi:large subunit ribosomal protein L10
MALTRSHKEQLVSDYGASMATALHAFVIGYQGIKVGQADDLRRRIRESGGSYEVVKNRLALIAIKGQALEGLSEHFTGPTAVAFCNDDPVALAKVLTDFAKDVPVLQFKAGLLDGQAVPGDQIKAIASLPSREELIAKLLYLMQSPISRFVRSLGAIPQQFVSVLDQISKQKEGA